MGFLSHSPWIIWAVVALLLIVLEAFISGFVILWFGIAAVPTAIIAYFFPHKVILQLTVFAVLSIVLLLSTRKLAAKLYSTNTPVQVGIDRLLGKYGTVLEPINPDNAKGLVRLDHEQWRAESEDGSIIEAGTRIQVMKIDGTRVIVKKAEQA